MSAGDTALEHVGRIIADKYRLLRLLGAGGMGAVYEAEHVFTKRRVALKRMLPELAKSALAAERFVRETQAPSSIGHPGIVQVLDGGSDRDGSLYLVLELLDGVSLREALEENALQPKEVVQIAIDLLEALASAHERGFVHRDIKPDNVFLAEDGRGGVAVKLLDFGIASLRDGDPDQKLTQTGAVLGTPLYMSPEQASGRELDGRSDLWSVGAMLYQALSTAAPFEGESYNALIVSIVTRAHLPLSTRRADLPAALYEVVERALRKDAGERFQSARDMLAALRAVRFDRRPQTAVKAVARPAFALPLTAAEPARAPRGSSRWWWAIGACAAVALAALGLSREPPPLQPDNAALGKLTPSPAPSQPESKPEPQTASPPEPAASAPTAPAAALQPTAASGLSTESITEALAARQPQLQACLQDTVLARTLAGTPTAQQLKLAIELRIAPAGQVESVRTEGAVTAELERCVRERLSETRFPAAAGATEFRFPLILESTILGQ